MSKYTEQGKGRENSLFPQGQQGRPNQQDDIYYNQ